MLSEGQKHVLINKHLGEAALDNDLFHNVVMLCREIERLARESERRRVLEGIDVDTWDLSGSIATGLKELGYLVKERSSRDDASAVWEAVRSAIHQGLHGKLKDTLRSEPAEPAETAEIKPILGPPDLEGVEDDALFVVWYTRGKGFVKHTTVEAATLREFPDLLKDIEMHIPLGVVKSPEPEAELPKCPKCGGTLTYGSSVKPEWHWFNCDECEWNSESCETKQAALEAAGGE